jgi:hypothetical protein
MYQDLAEEFRAWAFPKSISRNAGNSLVRGSFLSPIAPTTGAFGDPGFPPHRTNYRCVGDPGFSGKLRKPL